LEVRLKEPRNWFLYVLAATPSYPWPRHLLAEHGDDWHRVRPLVSNGAYVLDQFGEESLTLRANPAFDGPRGNIAEVEMRFGYGGEALEVWEAGEADVIASLESEPEADREATRMSPELGTTMLGFHPSGAFADARVRTAVAAPIVEMMSGLEACGLSLRAPGSGGLLPPAMPGHSHSVRPPLTMEQAAELLAEAGYPGGEGLPPLRLAAPGPMQPFIADIDEWMAKIGATVVIDWLTPGQPTSMLDTDAWVSGWLADYPDPDGFFRGLMSRRHMRVLSDPELDRMLAEARANKNRDERLSLYARFDQRLVEQSLLVPLGYARAAMLSRPWVQGLWSNAITRLRFDQATVSR
jgi:ABC-type oligopeptide transport system substrate-binding subunit